MNRNEMTNGQVVTTGAVGTAASLGAWLLSHTHQMNELLQMASLTVGLAVGCVSLHRLLTKKPKD